MCVLVIFINENTNARANLNSCIWAKWLIELSKSDGFIPIPDRTIIKYLNKLSNYTSSISNE